MELEQKKLSKSEWENIEIPITPAEKHILQFMMNCYEANELDRVEGSIQSLATFLKVNNSADMQRYLVSLFFKKTIVLKDIKLKPIKKADQIRISQYSLVENIWETRLVSAAAKNDVCELYKLLTATVSDKNNYVEEYGKEVFQRYSFCFDWKYIYAMESFDTLKLYSHQKELFEVLRNPNFDIFQKEFLDDADNLNICEGNLVLYVAPTGTGKTLTPIILSGQYRVIFLCAARHVGLSVAKSAVSIGRKVAFAFGCKSTDDIRLHNAAAVKYTVDSRSGAIRKVDNSIGSKVELIVCDMVSYLFAMYYMKAFNHPNNIVLFWDEPTISLDKETHELHDVIKNVWKKNRIPNVILSSATLPADVKIKFHGKVTTIKSYDFKKSIPLIGTNGQVIMPHHFNLKLVVKRCRENASTLRYLDIKEMCKFLQEYNSVIPIETVFRSFADISIETLKLHYLNVLSKLSEEQECLKQQTIFSQQHWGIHLTTSDAYTLKDGPTLFLAQDVLKISRFLKSSIPTTVIATIAEAIQHNNAIYTRLREIASELTTSTKSFEDDKQQQQTKKGKKPLKEKEVETNGYKIKLNNEEDRLRYMLKSIHLEEVYVPNKPQHIKHWRREHLCDGSFSSTLDSSVVIKIMELKSVTDDFKLLLLMGIGVFNDNEEYLEVMKELADKQRLFLIIASTDYIFGTNYQFCHLYLSKDLDLTSEKLIQCLGRVGRKSFSQRYSIRLRDDNIAQLLFLGEPNCLEKFNMEKLFL
jgi:hypothetical protein